MQNIYDYFLEITENFTEEEVKSFLDVLHKKIKTAEGSKIA